MDEISLAAMLAAKRLAGVTSEANLRGHVTHMCLPCANKAAHSGFEETSPEVQKRGISGSTKRTYVQQSFFLKIKQICLASILNKIWYIFIKLLYKTDHHQD